MARAIEHAGARSIASRNVGIASPPLSSGWRKRPARAVCHFRKGKPQSRQHLRPLAELPRAIGSVAVPARIPTRAPVRPFAPEHAAPPPARTPGLLTLGRARFATSRAGFRRAWRKSSQPPLIPRRSDGRCSPCSKGPGTISQ